MYALSFIMLIVFVVLSSGFLITLFIAWRGDQKGNLSVVFFSLVKPDKMAC